MFQTMPSRPLSEWPVARLRLPGLPGAERFEAVERPRRRREVGSQGQRPLPADGRDRRLAGEDLLAEPQFCAQQFPLAPRGRHPCAAARRRPRVPAPGRHRACLVGPPARGLG